jgi:hypothetical protein
MVFVMHITYIAALLQMACALTCALRGPMQEFFSSRACAVQTFISIKELIPTALKYDPNNRVTSSGIVVGMAIISASLLLFTI